MLSKIKKSDVVKRLVKGSVWSFVGLILTKLIMLISGILCAHVLTKEEYGQFGMVRSTIDLFYTVGAVGMGATTSKYIAQYLYSAKEKITEIYGMSNVFTIFCGVVISTVLYFFSNYIAFKMLNKTELEQPIKLGSLLLFVMVLNGMQNGALSGFEQFKTITINKLIASIFEALLMIVGAFYWKVPGAILGFGLGYAVLLLLNKHSISNAFKKHKISYRPYKFYKNCMPILYKFSLPALLTSLTITPIYWIIRTILVKHDGYGELALFEASMQWQVAVSFIPSVLGSVLLPILSGYNGNIASYKRFYHYNLMSNLLVSSFVAIAIIVASPYIIGLYGKEYDNSMPMIILMISSIIYSVNSVSCVLLTSRGYMWAHFIINILYSVVLLLTSSIIISYGYGSTGLALAFLISNFFYSILLYVYSITIVLNNKLKDERNLEINRV